jgi:meiotic recombination protein SPO11
MTTFCSAEDVCAGLEVCILEYLRLISSSPGKIFLLAKHRDAFVAAHAVRLLRSGLTASKRDVYYMCRQLFQRQENASASIHRVAAAIGIHSNNLNIVAAQKGLVAGSISFVGEQGEITDVALFGSSGILIPSRPERLTHIQTSASFILVVEKETVFLQLACSSPLLEEHACILITGKGYPDFATRKLLCAVYEQSGAWIPTFVLTDADPHGLHIALVYSKWIPTDRFQWIGVRPSEYDSLLSNLPKSAILTSTTRELKLAAALLSRSPVSSGTRADTSNSGINAIFEELEYITSHKFKFEIEALVLLHKSPSIVFDYVMHKINTYALAVQC